MKYKIRKCKYIKTTHIYTQNAKIEKQKYKIQIIQTYENILNTQNYIQKYISAHMIKHKHTKNKNAQIRYNKIKNTTYTKYKY